MQKQSMSRSEATLLLTEAGNRMKDLDMRGKEKNQIIIFKPIYKYSRTVSKFYYFRWFEWKYRPS